MAGIVRTPMSGVIREAPYTLPHWHMGVLVSGM